jgi:hypothetical protein
MQASSLLIAEITPKKTFSHIFRPDQVLLFDPSPHDPPPPPPPPHTPAAAHAHRFRRHMLEFSITSIVGPDFLAL